MKALTLLLFTGLTLLGAAGCATKETVTRLPRPMITGTVMYRARIALPPDAVLTVRLFDISRADLPPLVLADKSIFGPGNPPMPFEIPYSPGTIRAGQRFALEARIEVGGKLRFYSMAAHPVTLENVTEPHEVWVELVK